MGARVFGRVGKERSRVSCKAVEVANPKKGTLAVRAYSNKGESETLVGAANAG